jgi:hypothetical protein
MKKIKGIQNSAKARLNVGFVGFGNYTKGMWPLLGRYGWAQRHLYSNTNRANDYKHLKTLDRETLEKAPIYHNDIGEMYLNCDVVVIATGCPPGIIDYEAWKEKGRNGGLEKEMFRENFESVNESLRAARDVKYNGLIATISNPECFMDYGVNNVGLNHYKMFSIPNDTPRAARLIGEDFEKRQGKSLILENLSLDMAVVGPHCKPIILFDEIKYGDEKLIDIYPEYRNSEIQRSIVQEYRKLPLDIMIASAKLGTPYTGTQKQTIDVLRRLHFGEKLNCTLGAYVPDYKTFIDWPSEFVREEGGTSIIYDHKFTPELSETDDNMLREEGERRAKMIGEVLDEQR